MPDAIKSNDSNPPRPWFLTEQLITLAQAARLIPPLRDSKTGKAKSASPSTVYRWGDKGRQSQTGMIVKLEVHRVGGTNCTSIEAIDRFFCALNDKDNGPAAVVWGKSPPSLSGSQAKANAALDHQFQEAKQLLVERGYVD